MTRIGKTQDIVQRIVKKKLRPTPFGHICRMPDDRLLKEVVFGIMEGSNRIGRPRKRWTDDVEEWCNNALHTLSMMAADRRKWRQIVKHALDTQWALSPWSLMMMMMKTIPP